MNGLLDTDTTIGCQMSVAARIGDRFKIEFVAKLVSTLSGALLSVLLARLLHPDSYGLLFLSLSILGTVALFSQLGIAKSGARYISELKETEPEQIPKIITVSFVFLTGTSLTVGVCLFVARHRLSDLLGHPELVPFLTIGILYLVARTYKRFVRRILQGSEDIKPAASFHAIESGGRLVFALGFVLLGFGALGALSGYVLSSLVASVAGCYYIYTRYMRTADGWGWPNGSLPRRIAEYSFPLAATRSANVLDKRVDTILVGFFLNPTAVGFYVIGKQVAGFVQSPASALGFTVSPTFNSLQTNGETEKATTVLEESLTYLLLLYIPAAAGLILVAEPMVRLVFGSQYTGAIPVVRLLAVYAALYSVGLLVSNSLDYLGRARQRAVVKFSTSVMNVILNVVFIPLMGVVGAAVATVVTYSIYIAANLYIINLEFSLNFTYIISRIAKILVITLLMSVPVYGILSYSLGVITLTVAVLSGVVVWFGLSTTIGWLDPKRIVSVVS